MRHYTSKTTVVLILCNSSYRLPIISSVLYRRSCFFWQSHILFLPQHAGKWENQTLNLIFPPTLSTFLIHQSPDEVCWVPTWEAALPRICFHVVKTWVKTRGNWKWLRQSVCLIVAVNLMKMYWSLFRFCQRQHNCCTSSISYTWARTANNNDSPFTLSGDNGREQ